MNKTIYYKLLSLWSLLSIFQLADAQSLDAIRQQYNDIHQDISQQQKIENMRNYTELTLCHNVPGIGPQTIHYKLYFTPLAFNEDGELKPHRLLFVERKYNVAARSYYEEFLYDEKERPIFIYGREPREHSEEGIYIDTRCYFHEEVLLDMIITQVDKEGAQQLYRSSAEGQTPYVQKMLGQAHKIVGMFSAINKKAIPE